MWTSKLPPGLACSKHPGFQFRVSRIYAAARSTTWHFLRRHSLSPRWRLWLAIARRRKNDVWDLGFRARCRWLCALDKVIRQITSATHWRTHDSRGRHELFDVAIVFVPRRGHHEL